MKSQVDKAKETISIDSIASLLEVQKKSGNILWCCCPFHGEKTASLKFDTAEGKFHCFGCQRHGDRLDLYMQLHGISEVSDALKELLGDDYKPAAAAKGHVKLVLEVNAAAAEVYHDVLLNDPQAEKAREYLAKRGVPQEFIAKYQLGYAPDLWDFISSKLSGKCAKEDIERAGLVVKKQSGGCYDRFRDRIMFPILDHRGKVCAFGGRILGDGQPKYMNSPATEVFSKSSTLFGLHQHKDEIRRSRKAVVVEGNFDLLLLDVHGISNTVAPLGTALTKEHVHALRGRCDEAVLLFDGDAAGLRAAQKSVPLFLSEGLEAKAALLPQGHDPDSFVREYGAAAIKDMIDNAAPLPEFIFDVLVKEHGMTLAGKAKIMKEIDGLVASIPDAAQRNLAYAHFAGKLGIGTGAEEAVAVKHPATDIPPLPPMPEDWHDEKDDRLNSDERKLVEFLRSNPHLAGGIIETYCWSGPEAKAAAAAELGLDQTAGRQAAVTVDVEEVEQAIDSKGILTLDLPDDIANPGGLISLGMQGLSADGLPKYPQLNLPIVLSVIGQVLCRHISVGSKIPAFYSARIAPSQTGKSEGTDAMIYALRRAGMADMIGPSKLQSGQSIIRALGKSNNILCFCDEGARMFAGDKTGRDSTSKTMVETLLTLFTQNGSYYSNAYADSTKNVEIDWFAFGLCANAVPDVFDDVAISSLSNGLVTRLNFFCYDGPILARGVSDNRAPNSTLDKFAESLATLWRMEQSKGGDAYRGGVTSLSISKVKPALQWISNETVARCNEHLHDNIRMSIIGQIYDMTLRYAMVHAGSSRVAWEITDPLEEDDIVYGYRLARLLTDWKLDVLVRRVSGSDFEEQCNAFFAGVVTCHARYLAGRSKSKASIATISDRIKKAKGWPLKVWTEIINYMEETDRITVERRGAKMFFAPVVKKS